MIRWLLLTLVLPGLALAHGDRPRVVGLVFPPGGEADTVYALTDQQGLFANPKSGFRWLCEDAVAPLAGLRGLAFAGQRLVAATSVGLFASEDGGCGWARVEGPPAGHRLAGLWTHPTDGGWLVASQGEGVLNGVWRSDDEGETWTMAMPALRGRVRDLRWAVSDADRVYLGTTEGNWRSDDGGRSFAPLVAEAAIAPPVQPSEARLLAVDPDDADVVFA
ncbi:MAG: hypothetical protein KC620_02100, partial [Myxococcales bacterium]|nr:hypothetical protein [Myxococcales bacterium]